MNILNNAAYYTRRAQESRALAERAEDRGVKRIHLDMAQRYDALALHVGATTLRAVSESANPNRAMSG